MRFIFGSYSYVHIIMKEGSHVHFNLSFSHNTVGRSTIEIILMHIVGYLTITIVVANGDPA
jgi:cytosine/uracil/thiamine/allantoin permease